MAFKKDLPKWLSTTAIRRAGHSGLRTYNSVQCTVFRHLCLLLTLMLILLNIFANSRGYSTVMEYSRANPPGVPLQMDILCPAYKQDEALRVFGKHLGHAIRAYLQEGWSSSNLNLPKQDSTRITRFRLLIPRYPSEDQDKGSLNALRKELSDLTLIIPEDVVIVKAPNDAIFDVADAVNLLTQQKACRRVQCLVAKIGVDTTVLPSFFHSAVKRVYLQRKAYFPIVRNHAGTYCLSGPHAHKFQFLGGKHFYLTVRKALTVHRLARDKEDGLIHWDR